MDVDESSRRRLLHFWQAGDAFFSTLRVSRSLAAGTVSDRLASIRRRRASTHDFAVDQILLFEVVETLREHLVRDCVNFVTEFVDPECVVLQQAVDNDQVPLPTDDHDRAHAHT